MMADKIPDCNTHNDELDRLLWACQQWFAGWQPNPTITDRRDRDLYEAIAAMGPRLDALRDVLRRDTEARP